MFRQERIKYLEKPVTSDEKAIAALLEKIVLAITIKDVNLLVSAYSNDAKIEIRALKDTPISKSEYSERMSKFIGNVRNFYLDNTIIRVNGQEAIVSCVSNVLLRGEAFPEESQRYLKCVKESGAWYIIDAKYIVF